MGYEPRVTTAYIKTAISMNTASNSKLKTIEQNR